MNSKNIFILFFFSAVTIFAHVAIALLNPGSGCSRALHECVQDSVRSVDETVEGVLTVVGSAWYF